MSQPEGGGLSDWGALPGRRRGLLAHGHPAPSLLLPSGQWENPFSRSKTSPQDFHVDENTVVKVPMMLHDRDDHWYLHDKHVPCSVLRLDYRGRARALFILPDSGKMAQVEEVLTPQMLRRWNSLLQKR